MHNEKEEEMPTRLTTGWRVCIDYRRLNEVTRKDHFPLPFMNQLLERIFGHPFYCFLDGYLGYFQIEIAVEDQEKTTFTCPFGTYAYRRMTCHTPIPGPTRLADPNRVRVRDHILGLFTSFCFQSRTCTCGYGPHLITDSKYHIHIQKNYHQSGVYQNLYTYTESHLHIQKLYFYIYKSEHVTYCDEPLLVCWPSCMRKFSDVFSCTYTD